ncbi:MAG: chemotaxis protein CheD [Thermacetogeniaceae bacterium]
MNLIVIGIGEMGVDNAPGSTLKTFALGSCVGVVILAPRLQTAGLLHIALPDSSINQKLALERPGYFADTGIPILISKIAAYGCQRDDLVVKIAGGANIMDPENRFNIGVKNVLAVKKHLWRYRLGPVSESIGDRISRTLTVFVETGKVIIFSPGNGEWEL